MRQPISNFLVRSPSGDGAMTAYVAVGWIGVIWYFVVQVVCALGYFQVWRRFSRRPAPSPLANNPDAPHVTAIRPVKGLEPCLYDCLAATFRQDYPRDKLTICLCVATKDDLAYPILRKVIDDFPDSDARLYVEEEDPLLQGHGPEAYTLGPNPKIRNMSRAYREARVDDIIWIIDCNVWIGKGVCARMVDKLCGWTKTDKKYKFVHHLPIVVDVTGDKALREEQQEQRPLLDNSHDFSDSQDIITFSRPEDGLSDTIKLGGGRLEELFLSSAHAKFYTAINTVLIAPCIVGKSNMFRRTHLDYLTGPSPTDPNPSLPGIDFFSVNICEDHLIGDLLWRKKVREEKEGEKWGRHAMVFGDLAIQPVANMSIHSYIARRVRWLRVRKFTVLLATLVEPGTESFVCTLYGAWGITSALAPYLEKEGFMHAATLGTWSSFFLLFSLGLASWIFADWTLYIKLHSAKTVELDEETPKFAQPAHRSSRTTRRPFLQWLPAWLGRELLAFPIWLLAFYGGVTVVWRDRRFKVGFDAKVREIDSQDPVMSSESYTSSTSSVTIQNNGKLHKVRCE